MKIFKLHLIIKYKSILKKIYFLFNSINYNSFRMNKSICYSNKVFYPYFIT